MPALFVLPIERVPLVAIVGMLLTRRRELARGELSLMRVCARIADSAYALGPVLVLLALHAERFSWSRWPVLVVAFTAQVLCDAGSGLARGWFAEGLRATEQFEMLWLYAMDGCLFSVGLLVAASAVVHPGLILLTLPLLGLLGLLARERQGRLDGTLELSSAYRGTALLLGDVVEGDHAYTGMHSRDVVELSVAVADRMGLRSEQRQRIEFAALLHDVGKIRIPKDIIEKPGQLDEAEWTIMRRHTVEGEAMLQRVGGTLGVVGAIVRATHEHWNGGGYPDGLAGEAIPIEARIVCACDAYSAMTTDRSYRAALTEAQAVAELVRCSGVQFDPGVVEALIAVTAASPRR